MILNRPALGTNPVLRNGETRRAFTLFQSSPAKRRLQNDPTRPGTFAKATVGSEFQSPADQTRAPQNGIMILMIVAVFLLGIGIGDILSKRTQSNTHYAALISPNWQN
jgi:hypothetical protein